MNILKRRIVLFVLFTLFLAGCGPNIDEALYEESIENGLDYFAVEKYDEAEEQFNLALEEKENDEVAEALLEQTEAYREALNLFEEENYDEGFIQAQTVIDIPNGTISISTKAEELINEQKEVQKKLVEEAEKKAAEQAEIERKEEEAAAEQVEIEKKEAEELERSNETTTYEYSDFTGYYLHFDSDSRNHSDMVAGIGDDLIVIAWYAGEGNSYEILGTSIDGNTLTAEYYMPDPYAEDYGSYGTLEITLNEVDGEKTITFSNEPETTFYKVLYEDVLSYDYSLDDFVY